jgi:transposase-like protein
VNVEGLRELLGLKFSERESEAFWVEFITRLRERGLPRESVVISVAQAGFTNTVIFR